MSYRYLGGRRWTHYRDETEIYADPAYPFFFFYNRDSKLIYYGRKEDAPEDYHYYTCKLIFPNYYLKKNKYKRYKHLHSLKALLRFVRKCPYIRPGQRLFFVAPGTNYADIEITKE